MAGKECVMYPDQVREKLEGKTILVIGSSQGDQRYIWDIYSEAKIKVILVGHGTSNHEAEEVDTFIKYDYITDHSDSKKHASNIIQLLRDHGKTIDGCFTMTEEFLPITAVICENLKLRGLHPDAALIAWKKQNTYETLRSSAKTKEYSPYSYRIQKQDDIKEAKQITYPAILKPEDTAGSWGVVKVMSEDECLLQYNRIQKLFRASLIEHTFGTTMVLMELLDGLSFGVDVVIYDGELMTAFITDIGLYLPNRFVDTTTCIPSNLSTELQDQLNTAAHYCCCEVGLLNGVFNTEFKMTKTGPKLVEINGRIGCVRRCIVYDTTYGVNLWEVEAAIACGIKPRFPGITAKCFAVGALLFNKFHGGKFLEEGVRLKLRNMVAAKELLLILRPETEELYCEDEEFIMPFCHLVALNKTSIKHARQMLIQLFQKLGFTGTEYDIERFTSVWA